METPEPVVIFVHLPKTGGNTLTGILQQQYAARELYQVTAGKVLESVRHFISLPARERNAFRAICGHMPLGLHEYVERPCAYVTLLRDPVDRVISSYYYIRRAAQHPKHELLVANKMTLRDYVCGRISAAVHNDMVLRLCGGALSGNIWTDRLEATPAALETAKRNLDSFRFVGLTEEFGSSVELLGRGLGWRRVTIEPQNVSHERPKPGAIDGDLIEIIREKNRFDLDLYAHAREKFAALAHRAPHHGAGPRIGNRSRLYIFLRGVYRGLRKIGA